MTESTPEIQAEHDRYEWLRRNWLVFVIAVQTVMIVVLVVLAFNARSTRTAHNQTLSRIDSNAAYTKCEAKLLGQALSLPPAPNPLRLAVTDKLKNLDSYCSAASVAKRGTP